MRFVPLVLILLLEAALAASSPPPVYPLLRLEPGVVSRGELIGGRALGRWLGPRETALRLDGRARYRVFSLQHELALLRAHAPLSAGVPCAGNLSLRVRVPVALPGTEPLYAFAAPWNPLPRRPVALSAQTRTYRDLVAAALRSKGLARPQVHVEQVLQVDLDADGHLEVIIVANSRAGRPAARAAAGDYAGVWVRQQVDGRVRLLALEQEVHVRAGSAAPSRVRVGALLDLDGDGRLEVIVSGKTAVGVWTSVFSLAGGQMSKVLRWGCGA
ncbi:hypothetical protein HNR42_001546 [Deinobacterium chartae]|uniref:VCBS repeat-containing protein n=1 Tax=Deinobacterium chartae TaxID=521158 RepID=A0A841HX68_9DEIO|nr:VCBS repeat-containing protein [Deinobacterium chartae]MBB6098121.1 hypothetical protein [Deinobacterium chartae]